MRYSKYVGDMSIDLEGEPEEIIQVLNYIDDVNDTDKEIVLCINGERNSKNCRGIY